MQLPYTQALALPKNAFMGQPLPMLSIPAYQPTAVPSINLPTAETGLLRSIQAGASKAGGRLQHSAADILQSLGIDPRVWLRPHRFARGQSGSCSFSWYSQVPGPPQSCHET